MPLLPRTRLLLRIAAAVALIAASFPVLPAAAQAKRFTPEVFVKLTRVSDPQISPDGKSIVIVVGHPNLKTDKYDTELVLVDIATREQRVLTHGRHVGGYPRWSPAGDRLAYIAEDADKKAQVFVLPMSGGDSVQLTHAADAVSQFAWKPDGTAIAFAATDEPPKREGEAEFLDAFEVGANDSLVHGPSPSTHIWLIPASGGEAKRLTSGTWSLPVTFPPGTPSSPINWTPDGKSIAFVKAVTPLSGDAELTQMELLDAATGEFHPITGRKTLEAYPTISPDGQKISYWYSTGGNAVNINEVRVASLSGQGDRSLTATDIDRNMMRALWTADSKAVVVGANDGTTVGLWVKPLEGAPQRLKLGNLTPANGYWVEMNLGPKNQLALIGTTPERAAELYYLPSLDSAPVRLTNFNAVLDDLERGKSETVTWTSDQKRARRRRHLSAGIRRQAEVSARRSMSMAGRTPLRKETFNPMVQCLAAQGWVVFEPNYRGSDNMGNAFYASIYKDAGAGPGRDVMSGVEMLQKRGFVDSSKMAVSGWSYGGYMTTWLLGHYDVWKAAVAGASVTDWFVMYTTSDNSVTVTDQVGPSPYVGDNDKSWRDQSPITFAKNIKAPTLILHDTGDTRVPIADSYELYRALIDNGVTTKFFAYPIGGHFPGDPIRSRDVRKRWIDWLVQYLGTTAPAPDKKQMMDAKPSMPH